MGTVVTTKDVEKEGMSGDSNTTTGGESGAGGINAGELGGVWTGREYQETMWAVP